MHKVFKALKFIIYTPSYDENSGGVIALYTLADRLRQRGIDAMLWHSIRPYISFPFGPRLLKSLFSYEVLHRHPFDKGPYNIPTASYNDINNSIVVYPELINFNPLNTRFVVRWLLNKPGFFTGKSNYSDKDLFFYYMRSFDFNLNIYPDNELCLTTTNPAYVDYGSRFRSGTCHMIRKGEIRSLPEPANSIKIDGLSHRDTANVFNKTDRFICYDLYTRYTIYAALSGCLPIIVPEPGVSVEQWMPDIEDRYGIAYGEENIPWALATRGLLRERLAKRAAEEDAMLDRFLERCRSHFSL